MNDVYYLYSFGEPEGRILPTFDLLCHYKDINKGSQTPIPCTASKEGAVIVYGETIWQMDRKLKTPRPCLPKGQESLQLRIFMLP
jgi:hypothetical protein